MKHRVIGLDFGTSLSRIASYESDTNNPQVLTDERRRSATPSRVAVGESRLLVGTDAANSPPVLSILGIKRELGRRFTTQTLAFLPESAAQAGFRPGEGDPLQVALDGRYWLPQEIAAFLLLQLQAIAGRNVGAEVRDAVLTVPAAFTASRREALCEAALLAGLNPLQLVAETTAVALCQSFGEQELPGRRTRLVYCLGAGHQEVAVVETEGRNVRVVASAGEPWGAWDLDEAIFAWALETLRGRGEAVAADAAPRALLRAEAETARRELRARPTVELDLSGVLPGRIARLALDREQFEEIAAPLLKRSQQCVQRVLDQAGARGVAGATIGGVLLAGGAARTFAVRESLNGFFRRGEVFVSYVANPGQAAVLGAALLAHCYQPSGNTFRLDRRTPAIANPAAVVSPPALLIEQAIGAAAPNAPVQRWLDVGTALPASQVRSGLASDAKSSELPLNLYEGSQATPATHLGVLRIGPLEARPAGYYQFELTAAMDPGGCLTAESREIHGHPGTTARIEFFGCLNSPAALAQRRGALLTYSPSVAHLLAMDVPAWGISESIVAERIRVPLSAHLNDEHLPGPLECVRPRQTKRKPRPSVPSAPAPEPDTPLAPRAAPSANPFHSMERGFSIPLPVPEHTRYAELGEAPDISDDALRLAINGRKQELRDIQNDILKLLDSLFAKVGGLKEALVDSGEQKAGAQERLEKLREQALILDPAFESREKKYLEAAAEVQSWNKAALDKPAEREAYDAQFPPFALLRLAACTSDAFVQPAARMELVRRAVADFLERRGEAVYHPSDFTRSDFSRDFTPNPLLDGDDR